jgi:type VI secretion system protein ImpH
MARKDRQTNTDVTLPEKLAADPYHFGFFEVLRRMEALHPDKPRLGRSLRPSADAIRLGQEVSLRFASSTLSAFKQQQAAPSKLLVNFFGLFGPNGPLPLHLTEYARHRVKHAKDAGIVEFADVFHHRLLSLFYRAWADKEPTVQCDRPEDDRFGFYVDALLGLAEPGLQQRDHMPDALKRHFVGHLGCHTRHPEGLKAMIRYFFKLPVSIEEFVGEWLDIPEDSYCYLNSDDSTGQLGVSAIAGTRSWQCQNKFRIHLGPMSMEEYERMLPGGSQLHTLVDLVKNYIGLELKWDLKLLLKKEEHCGIRLGHHGRLGWSSWLGHGDATKRSTNLLLDAALYAAHA